MVSPLRQSFPNPACQVTRLNPVAKHTIIKILNGNSALFLHVDTVG